MEPQILLSLRRFYDTVPQPKLTASRISPHTPCACGHAALKGPSRLLTRSYHSATWTDRGNAAALFHTEGCSTTWMACALNHVSAMKDQHGKAEEPLWTGGLTGQGLDPDQARKSRERSRSVGRQQYYVIALKYLGAKRNGSCTYCIYVCKDACI